MAQRLNTKFIAILASTSVAGSAAALIGLKLLQKDADDHIAEAKQLIAENELRAANSEFGKAVDKEPDHIEANQLYLNSLKTTPVESIVLARDYSGQLFSLLEHIADLNKKDDDATTEYFQTLLKKRGIQSAHAAATKRLISDPNNIIAKRYRGLCVATAPALFPTPQDQQNVVDDLNAAIKSNPTDSELYFALASWELYQAGKTREKGLNQESYLPNIQAAFDFAQQGLKVAPQSMQARRQYFNTLLSCRAIEQVADQLKPALAEYLDLAKQLISQPETKDLDIEEVVLASRYAQTYMSGATHNAELDQNVALGLQTAYELVSLATEKDTNALLIKERARLEEELGMLKKASSSYQQLIKLAQQPAPAFDYLTHHNLALDARYQETRIQLSIAINQPSVDSQDQSQLIQKAKTTIDYFSSTSGSANNFQSFHLKALIATLESKHEEAINHFSRAVTLTQNKNQAILKDAIRSAQVVKNNGLEQTWLEQLVEQDPRDILSRIQLIRSYLLAASSGNPVRDYYALAKEQARFLLSSRPDLPFGYWYLAQVQSLQDQDYAGALQTIEPILDGNTNLIPRFTPTVAQWLSRSGQQEEAIKLLESRIQDKPDDLFSASIYVSMFNEQDKRVTAINWLKDNGVANEVIERMQKAVLGTDEERRELLAENPSSNTNSRRQYELQIQQAQNKGPQAVLEATETITEADPAFVHAWRARLQALIDLDQQEALSNFASIASKATNEDEIFWRARKNLFEQELNAARTLFTRGLTTNPNNAEALTDLGIAYLSLEQPAQAIEQFEKAISVSGVARSKRALTGLTQAHIAQNQPQEALKTMEALERNSLLYSAVEWMSYANLASKLGDQEKAVSIRQRVLKASPNLHAIRRQLAVDMANQSDFDAAQEHVDFLLNADSKSLANIKCAALVDLQNPDKTTEQANAHFLNYLQNPNNDIDYQDHLVFAEFLADANQTQLAIEHYQKAIALEPQDQLPATYILTRRYMNAGLYADAEKLLQKVTQQKPEDINAWQLLTRCYIQLGQPDLAVQAAENISDDSWLKSMASAQQLIAKGQPQDAVDFLGSKINDPDLSQLAQAELYRLRAYAYLSQTPDHLPRPQLAIEDLKKSLTLNPNEANASLALAQTYSQLDQHTQAENVLSELVQKTNGNPAFRQQLIQTMVTAGNIARAIREAQVGQEQDPEDSIWPQILTRLSSQMGDFSQAADYAQQAMALNENPQLVAEAIRALSKADRHEQVLEIVETHPAVFSQSPYLQTLRAKALQRTSRTDAADAVFRIAIEQSEQYGLYREVTTTISQTFAGKQAVDLIQSASSKQPQAWVDLAVARIEMANGRGESARTRLAQTPVPETLDPTAQLNIAQTRGILEQSAGQHENAKEQYLKALKVAPQNAETLNNLAYLLAKELNDPESALTYAQQASDSTNQRSPEIQDTLGWVYYRLNRFAEAQAVLEQVTRQAPSLAVSHLHLGRAYAAQGDARATNSFKRAIQLAQRQNQTDLLQEATQALSDLDAQKPAGG